MLNYDLNALKIYIDGSAFIKKNEYGYAGIVQYPDDLGFKNETIFKKKYDETTINRMELRACVEALYYVRKNSERFKQLGINRIIIISDSDYVVKDQINVIYWRKNKWRNRDGREIENINLWKKFLSIRFSIRINTEIIWQEGKSDLATQEIDQLAKKTAKSLIKEKDYGFVPGRVCKKKTSTRTMIFPANNQIEIIKIYGIKRKKTEKKIFFELFFKKEKELIESYYAYCSLEEDIHRHKYYKVSFNDNSRYPIFKIIKELKNIKEKK